MQQDHSLSLWNLIPRTSATTCRSVRSVNCIIKREICLKNSAVALNLISTTQGAFRYALNTFSLRVTNPEGVVEELGPRFGHAPMSIGEIYSILPSRTSPGTDATIMTLH